MDIQNIYVKELFDKVNGNMRKFHKLMCEVAQKELSSVNPTSLYWKAKEMFSNLKRYKKHVDKENYNSFCKKIFVFPVCRIKRKLVSSGSEKPSKVEKVEVNKLQLEYLHGKVNELKEKLRNLSIFRLNDKIRRQQKSIDRLKETIRDLKLRIKKQENNKTRKIECFEMATQCNTMGKIITDLKCALDDMVCQNEEADLNNNTESANYTQKCLV